MNFYSINNYIADVMKESKSIATAKRTLTRALKQEKNYLKDVLECGRGRMFFHYSGEWMTPGKIRLIENDIKALEIARKNLDKKEVVA